MAIKGLQKFSGLRHVEGYEADIEKFINAGGTVPVKEPAVKDHRLTLRLPPELLAKLDAKRKTKLSPVSRNQAILEAIEKFVHET